MVLETFLVTVSGGIHTANDASEIEQLNEACHTFGHLLWLREDGVSESSRNVCVCNVEQQAVAGKQANLTICRKARVHRRRQDRQRRMLLLILVSLFVNNSMQDQTTSAPMCCFSVSNFGGCIA